MDDKRRSHDARRMARRSDHRDLTAPQTEMYVWIGKLLGGSSIPASVAIGLATSRKARERFFGLEDIEDHEALIGLGCRVY